MVITSSTSLLGIVEHQANIHSSGLLSTSGGDDAPAFQWANDKLVAENGGGTITTNGGDYNLSSPVTLDSRITLDLNGGSVTQLNGEQSMFVTRFTSGTLTGTAGSAVVTGLTTPVFPGAMVGIRQAHESAAALGSFYAQVLTWDAGSQTAVLNEPLPKSVAGETFISGTIHTELCNGQLFGVPPNSSATSNNWPVNLIAASQWTLDDLMIVGGEFGAVYCNWGCSYGEASNLTLISNTDPANMLGTAFLLFQGAKGNTVRGVKVTGEQYIGIGIDERTTVTQPQDGLVEANKIIDCVVDCYAGNPAKPVGGSGISVSGIGNEIRGNTVRGMHRGVQLTQPGVAQEGPTNWQSHGNSAVGNTLIDCTEGVILSNGPTGSVVGPNTFYDCGTNIVDSESYSTTFIPAAGVSSAFTAAITGNDGTATVFNNGGAGFVHNFGTPTPTVTIYSDGQQISSGWHANLNADGNTVDSVEFGTAPGAGEVLTIKIGA